MKIVQQYDGKNDLMIVDATHRNLSKCCSNCVLFSYSSLVSHFLLFGFSKI